MSRFRSPGGVLGCETALVMVVVVVVVALLLAVRDIVARLCPSLCSTQCSFDPGVTGRWLPLMVWCLDGSGVFRPKRDSKELRLRYVSRACIRAAPRPAAGGCEPVQLGFV